MKLERDLWNNLRIGAMIFVVGVLSIVLTNLDNRFHLYSDMGTSSTGLALSRAFNDGYCDSQIEPCIGYINNGFFSSYSNWPILGFRVFALWYRVIGDDSLNSARWLTAFVYGFNALLFFVLMIRVGTDRIILVIGVLIFVLLPHHLTFGKLIFADIWLLTFWLIIANIYISQRRYRWLIIPLSIIGTGGFMWFVIFILLAIAYETLSMRMRLTYGKSIICLLPTAILIWAMIYAVIYMAGDYNIFIQLRHWSIFGFTEFESYVAIVVNFIKGVIYEVTSLLLLIIYILIIFSHRSIAALLNLQPQLFKILKLFSLTIFFMVVTLPMWVLNHGYAISFFSIPITVVAIYALEMVKHKIGPMKSYSLGAAVVCSTLTFYFISPMSCQNCDKRVIQVNQIVDFINNKQVNDAKAICLFFHLPKYGSWPHAFEFGIKEQTDSYIFSNGSLKGYADIPNYFEEGMKRLRANDKVDFHSTTAWFITNKELDVTKLEVVDSARFQDIRLYEIAM